MNANDKIKLTKRSVEALVPREKEYYQMDAELSCFGIRVNPSGVRSYFLRYRNEHNRQRKITLGQHGKITPDQARAIAKKQFAAIADGVDPSSDRANARTATKVSELLARYLEDHVMIHNKPGTQKEVARLIKATIIPAIGHMTVKAIERKDIAKLHRSLKNTPTQANRVRALLSKAFNLAEEWGLRPDGSNPCRHIKKYKETARERFLSDKELGKLGQVLNKAEQEQREAPGVINSIRLLALTGCRLNEVLSLRWADIDLKLGVLNLPDTKTGKRSHVIGSLAQAFIASLPHTKSSPWVFPRKADISAHIRVNHVERAWRLRIRIAAGIDDARLHDLRHTVGTYAGQTGANAFLVRDKLGHASTAMTDRYVNRDDDPLRKLTDQVEGRVVAAMTGNKSGDVIPLKRGKA